LQLAKCEYTPRSYIDDKAGWDIAVLIAKHFRRLLKERVKKSPYFGIMVDETTDNSTSLQMLIYIKFIDYDEDTHTFYVVIEYLDMVSPKSGEAEDLTVSSLQYQN
jgi:hypothetical protein